MKSKEVQNNWVNNLQVTVERNHQVLAPKWIYRNGGEKQGVTILGMTTMPTMTSGTWKENVQEEMWIWIQTYYVSGGICHAVTGGQQVSLVKTSSLLGLLLPLLASAMGKLGHRGQFTRLQQKINNIHEKPLRVWTLSLIFLFWNVNLFLIKA